MKSLQLSQIWIYPVKSLGGISLSTARVLPKGLPLDRRWMLVDEQGVAMTQRVYPKMALFKLASDDHQLDITFQQYSLSVPFREYVKEALTTKIWEDSVHTCEVSRKHSEWFCDMLGVKCKLMHFPEENPRPVEAAYNINDSHVSLADAYPFLIIGQSSLDDLNKRLQDPIPMDRFRPNFVFTGGEPFEEDNWKDFTIGENKFAGVKPCARCAIPTIDQHTAEKGIEPTKTLATYRRQNNKIYFGQNVIALEFKTISVGDQVSVSE